VAVTGIQRGPSGHGSSTFWPNAGCHHSSGISRGPGNPYEAPASIGSGSDSAAFNWLPEPAPAFHRNPVKPGSLSDSCAEPFIDDTARRPRAS